MCSIKCQNDEMKRNSSGQQTMLGSFVKKQAVAGTTSSASARGTPNPPVRVGEAEVTVLDDAEEDTAKATAKPASNAFALMLNAQKSKALAGRAEVFELNLVTNDGRGVEPSRHSSWTWSWVPSPAAASSAWQGEVKIRQPGGSGPDKAITPVRLRTNVPTAPLGASASASSVAQAVAERPDAAVRVSPSILKSCLQKAVRRGLADSAIAIARHMWLSHGQVQALGQGQGTHAAGHASAGDKAPVDQRNELLRRLPIIMVEDIGLLHPALPVLTWLMLACGSGYVPGEVHWAAVKAILADMCACKYKDVVPRHALATAPSSGITSATAKAGSGLPAGSASGASGANQAEEKAEDDDEHSEPTGPITTVSSHALDPLPQPEACLLRCLIARASYGGIKGDVIMLLRTIELYHRRFTGLWHAPKMAAAGSTWMDLLHELFSVQPSTTAPSTTVLWSTPTTSTPAEHGKDGAGPSRLTARLMPAAGVDFHCSNILQDVLSMPDPRAQQARSLLGVNGTGSNALSSPTEAVQQAADRLGAFMWNRRSGVNCREPILTDANTQQERAAAEAQYRHDTALLGSSGIPSGQGATLPLPRSGAATLPAAASPEAKAYLLIEPLLDPWTRTFLSSRMPS